MYLTTIEAIKILHCKIIFPSKVFAFTMHPDKNGFGLEYPLSKCYMNLDHNATDKLAYKIDYRTNNITCHIVLLDHICTIIICDMIDFLFYFIFLFKWGRKPNY
jgi:hypothetical protein